MPVIKIHVNEGYTDAQKRQMMQAVTRAVVEGFSVSDQGLYCCLEEYPPKHLLLVEGTYYLHVTVDCFAGRTSAQKQAFYRLAVQNLEEAGISPQGATFLVREEPLHNWSVGGGLPAQDFFTQKHP